MKLKSNREYWNELRTHSRVHYVISAYGKQMQFTGQEPKLEMFVNLLEKPDEREYRATYDTAYHNYEWRHRFKSALEQYQQAEDKILFKGFGFESQDKDGFCLNLMYMGEEHVRCVFYGQTTLESFVGCELTENGIKQLGYEK